MNKRLNDPTKIDFVGNCFPSNQRTKPSKFNSAAREKTINNGLYYLQYNAPTSGAYQRQLTRNVTKRRTKQGDLWL